MRPTTSAEIRQAFLEFFEEFRHERVASAPLPLHDNPTLLFTNAGMNQFTDVFLGKEQRAYSRAVTSQKCMRVQGKHNDLENVGPSPRHHTFFEMLGNFSFGDYFKKEAIQFAWTFLTKVMKLDKERLWATIYLDDDEAFALWQEHLPPERVLRFDKDENYWQMGDVGPCGPCSELHYYLGPLDEQRPEGVNRDDDYLEVWNLVFMQFDRDQDGNLTPLPRPSIDTGLGLERLAQITQGVDSNYGTDLFKPALERTRALLGDSEAEMAENIVGYRVIADHGRAATFLVGDGVRPGNTGASYVLRMIIRRAARYGRKIGFNEPFLAEIADVYIDTMGDVYPALRKGRDHIRHTITQEEERFARTLDMGLLRLDELLNDLHQRGERVVSGEAAFNLYATHGLPLEITRDVAAERGVSVDETGYDEAREAHALASGSGAFAEYDVDGGIYNDVLAHLVGAGQLASGGVDYDPYAGAEMEAEIVALIRDGESVDRASAGDQVEVVTAATPFYVEAGGEVSDSGTIFVEEAGGEIKVTDARRPVAGLIIHAGEVAAAGVAVGQTARLVVDDARRWDIRRNHTATHVLHRELRRHLGNHVTQAGSLVAPDRLRFDFSHGQAVDKETLNQIERGINDAILANLPVRIEFMGQKEAIDKGAMALFGEKYGEVVRTIIIGNGSGAPYSFELCGGLHVNQTGEIGLFHFTGEEAVGTGVRRVEAVTGRGSQALVSSQLDTLERVAGRLKTPVTTVEERLEAFLSEQRRLSKELAELRRQQERSQLDALLGQLQAVAGVKVLAAQVDVADANGLRQMADWFRDVAGSGAAVLATVSDGSPLFIATVTEDLIDEGLKAGQLARAVADLIGGRGGGRPSLAQGGGGEVGRLAEALAAVPGLVESALGQKQVS